MLICFTATAGIYKWVDENGKIHYSDSEVEGAEQVELPKAVTYTPTATNPAAGDETKPEENLGYTNMSIVKPKMNETIRNNNGDVDVGIDLTPGLKPGNSITLYLDGKEALRGSTQTSITLSKVERGTHTLRASVFDKNSVALISSNSIIFHLKMAAVETKDNTPKDNSEAYTPDFNQDEGTKADYKKDLSKDYGDDFSKDYGSSNTYKEKAQEYKKGVPSGSGTFTPGSNYSPNYNQK